MRVGCRMRLRPFVSEKSLLDPSRRDGCLARLRPHTGTALQRADGMAQPHPVRGNFRTANVRRLREANRPPADQCTAQDIVLTS